MSDWILSLVPLWGPWLLAATTFLSCLALPVPASLMMLTAGGFVASEDLVLWQVISAAWIGAVLGDQTGFALGRRGGAGLMARLRNNPKRARMIERAEAQIAARGGLAVFLTRWLFSPLGPYVNFSSGAAGMGWGPFSRAGGLGEAVWVGVYVGMGFAFAGNIEAAYDVVGSVLGFLAAGAVTVGLGLWLRTNLHALRPH